MPHVYEVLKEGKWCLLCGLCGCCCCGGCLIEVNFWFRVRAGRSSLWNGEEDMSMRSLYFFFGILFDFCILCITFFH